jgi:gluconolactonase
MSGGNGPDGMALADDGSIAVAHVGLGAVWIFDRLGEPIYRLVSCEELSTTNIAFGGPNQSTLFITESDSGTILAAEVGTAGRALYSHM